MNRRKAMVFQEEGNIDHEGKFSIYGQILQGMKSQGYEDLNNFRHKDVDGRIYRINFKGEGSIDGRALTGSASMQLVMATVPSVDPAFAFVPRMVSTRIVSDSNATVAADGTVHIEIENKPAPGEESYAPTRTTLSGFRVSSTDVLGGVAARPPE